MSVQEAANQNNDIIRKMYDNFNQVTRTFEKAPDSLVAAIAGYAESRIIRVRVGKKLTNGFLLALMLL